MDIRPSLSKNLEEVEFKRWYWTMAELQPFARSLGVTAAGPKAALTERIAAHLGGRKPRVRSVPKSLTAQLDGDLTRATLIPSGQKSTEALRSFFQAEVGSGFKFNGHMRAFLSEGGSTLGDAIEHWHRTVGTPLPRQSESLEFNQFTKAWHVAHPDGTATECRAAWAAHRALPVDQRPVDQRN